MINGYTALELEEGIDWDDADPILLWSVELRCEGKNLPDRTEEARRSLLEHAEPICKGLQVLAEELRVGLDYNTWPLVWPVPSSPRGVRMAIACRAMLRSDALAMARVLRDLSANWRKRLEELPLPIGGR